MTDQHNYSDNTAMQQSEDDPLEELARIVSGDYKSQPGANHWPRTTPTLPREARQTERPAMHAETQTVAPPQTDDFDLESELERELGASNVRALPEEPVEESVSDEQDESAHEDAGEAEAGPSGGDPLEDALLAELSVEQDEPQSYEQTAAQPTETPAAQPVKWSLVDRLFPASDLTKPEAEETVAEPEQDGGDEFYAEMDSAFASAVEDELAGAEPVSGGEPSWISEATQTDQEPAAPTAPSRVASDRANVDMDFSAAFEEQVRQMESTAPAQDANPFDEIIGPPRQKAVQETAPAPVQPAPPAPKQRAPAPDFNSIWQQAETNYRPPEPQPDDSDDQFASAFAEELALSDEEPASPTQMLPQEGGWQSGETDRANDDFAYAAAQAPQERDEYYDTGSGQQDDRYADYDGAYDQPVTNDAYSRQDYYEQEYADDGRQINEPGTQQSPQTAKSGAAGFKFAAMALGAALLIGGVAIGYALVSGNSGSGDPVVIKADPGPVKVKPDDPGGAQVANQDQPSYERVSGGFDNESSQERLVSNTEEPVNLSTLTSSTGQSDSKADARLQPGQEQAAGEESGGQLAPRRVRTVAVKPDGTLVPGAPAIQTPNAGEQAAIEAKIDGASGLTGDKAASQVPPPPALPSIDGARSSGQIAIPSPRPAPGQRSSATSSTDPVVTAVADNQLPSPTKVGLAPIDATPVSQTPQTTEPATRTLASQPPARSDHMVQLSSQRTAEDAQKTFQDMKRKHASLLDGRQLSVERAEIEGRGVFYRVRVLAESEADAAQLCRGLQLEGGSCFVTR